jgi:uncharacterized protein YpmB
MQKYMNKQIIIVIMIIIIIIIIIIIKLGLHDSQYTYLYSHQRAFFKSKSPENQGTTGIDEDQVSA